MLVSPLSSDGSTLVAMAKGDWSTSYVVPSVALSATATGFLVWHLLDPATHILSGWTVTLIVVAFLPWLRTVFESIEFPGGGSVRWREKVEAEQRRQAEDIRALRFLTARFLNDDEREALENFASGKPMSSDAERDLVELQFDSARIGSLHRMKLIETKPEIVEIARRGRTYSIKTFNELYKVSARGQEYLDILAQLSCDQTSAPFNDRKA